MVNCNSGNIIVPTGDLLDNLSQDELERIISLARKVKSGTADVLLVSRDKKNGRLFIKQYRAQN